MNRILVYIIVAAACALLVIYLIDSIIDQVDPLRRADIQHAMSVRAAQREAVASIWTWVNRVVALAVAVTVGAIAASVVALAIVAWAGAAKARNASAIFYPKDGLYPAVYREGTLLAAPNEHGAQQLAALAQGNITRLPSAAWRTALTDTPPDTAITAVPYIPVSESLRFDPHNPHWLLVGSTGSGKSKAIYNILDYLHGQARVEVVICEIGAVDWGHMASADTYEGYLAALEALETERLRRVALLRRYDVDHIARLPDPPPYLAVVLEEAESVYGNMPRAVGRDAARRFVQLLRDFSNMGRKQGIMLLVATQSGTSEVFDLATRKNFGHRLFFRSEPMVGDSWGIPRHVNLPTLPPGTAYDLGRNALVSFPLIRRPEHLRLSSLYRGNTGIDVITDQAIVVSGAVSDAVYDTVSDAVSAEIPEPGEGVGGNIPIPPTITYDQLTPQMRRRIWDAYRRTGSLRGAEAILWPDIAHGGDKFYLIRSVVQSNPRYAAQLFARNTTDGGDV